MLYSRMKQQLIEAGKVIIFGFISGNMIIDLCGNPCYEEVDCESCL